MTRARRGFDVLAEALAENIADRDRADRGAGHIRQFEHRHAGRGLRQFDLDLLFGEFAVAQVLAERVARGLRRTGADERIEQPLFRGELGARLQQLALCPASTMRDRDLDEIADDLLDVAADIADLGEFRRLDLEERRIGELGEAARNLGLAAAGRPDHQNVLRHHLVAHRAFEMQTPPAIAQRDGDGALGLASGRR